MTQVTANPVAMQEFVTGMGTAKGTLADAQTTEAATVRAFLNEGSTGITGGYEIVGPAMNALIHELVEVKDWVKVVRDAAIEADVGAHGDHTISADALNVALNRIAGERGIDLQALAASNIVTPPVTGITPVPQDSGFVNDPVCTATGHLLVDATDFAMPARLAVLSFRRLYASQDMADGAFGPGWWSWADARGGINGRGAFELFGPDARHATFEAAGDGGFVTPPHLDVDATTDGDAQLLRWGRRSPYFGQTWVFRAGLLREVVGPFVGSTTFHHDGRSRLVRLDHDSGRSVQLVWAGRTVAGLRASDGRQARFRYDRRGHLVDVRNAVSPETYDVDEQGRIRSITDADGVQVVAMTYDDDGRVVAQISQTGLTTRFGYAAGLRTTLSDAAHTPISVYTHDEQGRVEMYATAGGLRFSRRFDQYGRVIEQHEPDGTSVRMTEHTDGTERIEQFTSSTGQVERFAFDPLDRLVHHTAEQGATTAEGTRFEYHGDTLYPRRLEVDGELGLAVELAWEHGVPSLIVDSDGVADEFEVAADGTVTSSRNAVGDVTRYEYSPAGAIAARYLPDGRVVGYERDDAGRLLAMVNPAGERGELTYTAAGPAAVDPRLRRRHDQPRVRRRRAPAPCRRAGWRGDRLRVRRRAARRGRAVRQRRHDRVRARRVRPRDGGRRRRQPVDDRSRPGRTRGQGHRSRRGGGRGRTRPARPVDEHRRFDRRAVAARARAHRPRPPAAHAHRRARGDLHGRRTAGVHLVVGRQRPGTSATPRPGASPRSPRAASGSSTATTWPGGCPVSTAAPAGGSSSTTPTGAWCGGCRPPGASRTTSTTCGASSRRSRWATSGGRSTTTRGDGSAPSPIRPGAPRPSPTTSGAGWSPRRTPAACRCATPTTAAVASPSCSTQRGGAVSYDYNAFHQLTSITDQLGRSINATYDRAGRYQGTSYVDPRPDRPAVPGLAEIGADVPADVEALVAGGTGVVRRSESPDGLVTTWLLASGATVELERDADGFAAVLTSPGFLRRWVRDDCGRILAVTDEIDGAVHVTTLDRDGAGRIVRQDVDGEITEFAYGPAGELVARVDAGGDARWEYDELGRLRLETTPELERRFRYDAAHQLVELVEVAAGAEPVVTTFEYDGRGRRVRASGASDIIYVWGDRTLDAVVVDGDVRRYRSDESGRVTAAGDIAVQWDEHSGTYQPSAIGDEAIITVDATTAGGVDPDGRITWRPFTVADAWGGGSSHGARWHEYYGVEADGLVWLGSRPYDPTTRQFLATDPQAPAPGTAGGASPYTYAANDPINLFDPSGNSPISIDAFNDMRDRKTGPQWQNIATVAIAVVAVAVTIATAGAAGPIATILIGTAIGAASGAASGFAREGLESWTHVGDGQFNGETIIKDTLTGAAGGAFGAGVGLGFSAAAKGLSVSMPTLTRVVTSRGGSVLEEAVGGFGEGVMGETYDVTLPKNWGADGQWDNGAIAQNTVISAGAGGAFHGLHAPGHGGSPTGGADPSATSVDSPAPNHGSLPHGNSDAPNAAGSNPNGASTHASGDAGNHAGTHPSGDGHTASHPGGDQSGSHPASDGQSGSHGSADVSNHAGSHPSGDAGSHPAGDAGSHPGGDHAGSHPAGDAGSHPAGDHAGSHPAGDAGSHPAGDHAGSHPAGDAGSHPAGDHAGSHPAGDAGSHPGGDHAGSHPAGDAGSHPAGDHAGSHPAGGGQTGTHPQANGDTPSTHPHGDTPGTHGSSETPGTHANGETPNAHGDTPSTHADTPNTHANGDAPSTHTDTPNTHANGDAPSTHTDTPNTHANGDAPSTHADTPSTHANGDTPSTHADTPSTHSGHAEHAHADTPSTHADTPSTHSETPTAHADTPSTHGDTPTTHADTPSTHGDTPSTHGDTPSTHARRRPPMRTRRARTVTRRARTVTRRARTARRRPPHADTPGTHGDTPSTHADTSNTHANGDPPSAHGETPSTHADAPSTHADADTSGSHPHADTDAATAATSSAVAASAASSTPSAPGTGSGGPTTPGSHGPSTDGPPPNSSRTHVVVERTEPVRPQDRRRRGAGEPLQDRRCRLAHTDRQRPGDARWPGRHDPRQRDHGDLRRQRRPDAVPRKDHRAVPEHLPRPRELREGGPAGDGPGRSDRHRPRQRTGSELRRRPRRRAPVLPRARPGQHVPAGERVQPARVHAVRERDGLVGARPRRRRDRRRPVGHPQRRRDADTVLRRQRPRRATGAG